MLAVCDDDGVIGAPFYVMERLEGEVVTDAVPAALDDEAGRRRMGEELVDALVTLHGVDWRAAGLEGFGRPEGYLERQVKRFGGLWERNRTRELPAVERVGRWLGEHLPESPPATIVHGDFRLGQRDVRAGRAGARRGDLRLGDVDDRRPARRPRLPVHVLGLARRPAGRASSSSTRSRARPASPRARSSSPATRSAPGRSMSDIRWYEAMALWKIIVFMEGNYRRALAGSVDDPYLTSFGEAIAELAERAEAITR